MPSRVVESSNTKDNPEDDGTPTDARIETGTFEPSAMDWSQPVTVVNKSLDKSTSEDGGLDWGAPVQSNFEEDKLELDWSQPVLEKDDDELKLEWSDDPESEDENVKKPTIPVRNEQDY